MTQHRRETNGFEYLEIKNENAAAKIALQGAHVFEYTPTGEAPLLWVSPDSFYQPGKAIRGGIPVCWPWFGKRQDAPELPQHGFARTSLWSLSNVEESESCTTVITLVLRDSEASRALFPFAFELTLKAVISKTLSVTLTTTNRDDRPFTITEALHTYFNVGQIEDVVIRGLEGVEYADNLEDFKRNRCIAPITVDREIDRVYVDSAHDCTIEDASLKRKIGIQKAGSRSTVVWNPWIEKAAGMADFSDEGYKSMVCIETANALEDALSIAPGQSHTISLTTFTE